MSPRARIARAAAAALLFVLTPGSTVLAQAPTRQVHELRFKVHKNLIDAYEVGNPGLDGLAYYDGVIQDAMRVAEILLEGEQGPPDSPCCSTLEALSVAAFDGRDVELGEDDLEIINFSADLNDLLTLAGGQPTVFFVDSLSSCGGAAGAIGCAESASCNSPRDVSVVTTDALEFAVLGATIAHERGHNTCLAHVNDEGCQLMAPVTGGGCLSPSECTDFDDGATTTGGTCECLASATAKVADGLLCTVDAQAGVCSGGLCDAIGATGSARLFSAADPTFAGFESSAASALYDDGVFVSGTTGDWADELDLGSGIRPTGSAYSPERDVLYTIAPISGGHAQLDEIDPTTGSILASHTLTGRDGIISLAWDPGPTASTADDRLLAVERRLSQGDITEYLVEITPSTGVAADICSIFLANGVVSGFLTGLAYDAANQRLFAGGLSGLRVIDTNPVNNNCAYEVELSYPQPNSNFVRDPAGLAWSSTTATLFMIGNQQDPFTLATSTLYDSLDTTGFVQIDSFTATIPQKHETIQLDDMTVGGLAALPVAEPRATALGCAALAALQVVGRSRRKRRGAMR